MLIAKRGCGPMFRKRLVVTKCELEQNMMQESCIRKYDFSKSLDVGGAMLLSVDHFDT